MVFQRGQAAPAEVERVLAAARRVLPLARSVSAGVRTLALVALAAAAVIVASVLAREFPSSAGGAVGALLLSAVVAAPGVVLLLFHFALQELVQLPGRLRALPREGRAYADELARLEGDARERGRARGWRLPLALWRLVASLRGSGWVLRPYAPVAAVLSPTLLLAVGLSVLATPLLVLGAFVAALAALAA
ncbi:MAG: hypothetical protein ICV64_07485 [Thermoleophilia bacterium]|nr:hypothetical protein [Thermoleophilia bacterium]